MNPGGNGTKAAGTLPARRSRPGGSATVRVRLRAGEQREPRLRRLRRRSSASASPRPTLFYAALQNGIADEDMRRVQRQAFAGMLWNKQFYDFDVRQWLNGDPLQPPPPASRKHGRNSDWRHLVDADIISMPDKWEYPWFAAWDLAFHCVTLSLIDPEFAKGQLDAAVPRLADASERPAAGLRMDVRRRQPAGACLGGHARVTRSTAIRTAEPATSISSSASSTSCC